MKHNTDIQFSKDIILQLATDINIKLEFEQICNLFAESITSVYLNYINYLENIEYELDISSSVVTIKIYQVFNIVNKVNDINTEILNSDPKVKNAEGTSYKEKLSIKEFIGRMEINKIRHIFKQKCISLNNENVYELIKNYKGKLVLGSIESIQDIYTKIKFNDIVGILPKKNQIPGEKLLENTSIEVYVEEIYKNSKQNFPVIFSRSSIDFLHQVIISEVPEIAEHIIVIKKILRIPGIKSKIGVYTKNEWIDPIGSCIGYNSDRILNISRRCNNEKIDFFLWSENEQQLILNVLWKANPLKIFLNEDNEYDIIIPTNKMNFAIGYRGSNLKLLSKLVNKKVNIISLEDAKEKGFTIIEDVDEEDGSVVEIFEDNLIDSISKKTDINDNSKIFDKNDLKKQKLEQKTIDIVTDNKKQSDNTEIKTNNSSSKATKYTDFKELLKNPNSTVSVDSMLDETNNKNQTKHKFKKIKKHKNKIITKQKINVLDKIQNVNEKIDKNISENDDIDLDLNIDIMDNFDKDIEEDIDINEK